MTRGAPYKPALAKAGDRHVMLQAEVLNLLRQWLKARPTACDLPKTIRQLATLPRLSRKNLKNRRNLEAAVLLAVLCYPQQRGEGVDLRISRKAQATPRARDHRRLPAGCGHDKPSAAMALHPEYDPTHPDTPWRGDPLAQRSQPGSPRGRTLREVVCAALRPQRQAPPEQVGVTHRRRLIRNRLHGEGCGLFRAHPGGPKRTCNSTWRISRSRFRTFSRELVRSG